MSWLVVSYVYDGLEDTVTSVLYGHSCETGDINQWSELGGTSGDTQATQRCVYQTGKLIRAFCDQGTTTWAHIHTSTIKSNRCKSLKC